MSCVLTGPRNSALPGSQGLLSFKWTNPFCDRCFCNRIVGMLSQLYPMNKIPTVSLSVKDRKVFYLVLEELLGTF